VPKYFSEARRLFELAAAQGYADAQVALSRMHHDGKGGPQDFSEARLTGEAAAHGSLQSKATP
jgi:TPR repeat protein